MKEDKRPLFSKFLGYLKGGVSATPIFAPLTVGTAAARVATNLFPDALEAGKGGFDKAMGAIGGAVVAADDAISGGFLAPGAALNLAPGVVQQQAAGTGASSSLVADLGRTGTERVEETKAQAAEEIGTVEVDPLGPVGPLIYSAYQVDRAWSHAVTRPASTLALLTDPTSPLYQGGRLDVGDVNKPSIEGLQWQDVIDAWNRSADISFGRSVVASPFFANTAGLAGGIGKYDPWSNASMAEADENAYYNFVSGTIDFGLEVVFPTKGIRPARIAAMKKTGLSTNVASADDLIRFRADYEMHRVHQAAREVQNSAKNQLDETLPAPGPVALTDQGRGALAKERLGEPGAKTLDMEVKPLSPEAAATLDQYVNGLLYYQVNDYLRSAPSRQSRNLDELPEGAIVGDPVMDSAIPLLDEVTYANVATEPFQVFRGQNMAPDTIPVPGQTTSYREYLSTSRNQDTARNWTDGGVDAATDPSMVAGASPATPMGTTPVWFTIDVPVGARFADVAKQGIRKDQEEIILPRDTNIRVTNVEDVFDPDSGALIGKEVFAEIQQQATRQASEVPGEILETKPLAINAADEAVLRSTETPIGRSVDELAAETGQYKIETHPLIANATGIDKAKLSDIIAKTDDPDTVFELIAATNGDLIALRRLWEAAPNNVWALSEMGTAVRNAWMDGKPPMPTGEAAQGVRQTFDSALSRDEYFTQVKELFTRKIEDGLEFAPGSMWMPTRSLLVEEIRKKGRATEYAIKTADFDDAPRWISQASSTGLGQPVTVFLQWTSSRQPLGTVSRSGARPNDMYIEFESMLNSLPFMSGARPVTVGQDLVDGKMTPMTVPANDYRLALRQRLVDGNNNRDIQNTWRSIEDELIDVAADTLGIDRSIAKEFVRGYRMQADTQVSYLAKEGFLLDEAGQRILVDPVSQRQFLDSFATLPMNDIYLAMRTELSNLQKGLIRGGQIGTSAFDAGLKFWRTNLLFRAGYFTKFGVTEPLIMTALSHGTILADEGLMATVGKFSRNRAKEVKRVAYNLDLDRRIKKHVLRQPVQTRKQVEGELKKLVQERHDTERVIDGLVAELDDMRLGRVSPSRVARYQDEVRDRLVDAQIRLDAIQDVLDGKMPQWRQVTEPANLSDVRGSLRKYRAILGEDPNYVNELRTEIADIQARATARGGRMTVNDRSKYEKLVAELEEIQSVDPKTITPELRERIAAVQSSYDDAIQYYKDPVNDPTLKIQELEKNLKRIDSQIQARQVEIGKGRQEIGEVTGERGFEGSGQDYMTLNIGGEQFRVPAAFSDRGYDFGPGYRAESSAAQTSRLTLDPSYRMGETSSQWRRSGAPEIIDSTNPLYWDELAYSANRHLRGDRLIQRYLEGQSKAEIAIWLRSAEGVAYQKSMGKKYLVPSERYSDPVRPLPDIDPPIKTGGGAPSNLSPKSPRVVLESTTELDEIIRLIDQYFPDPKVRQMIAAREVTPGDLQKAMGGRDDLSRILTEDLIFTPQGEASRVMSAFNKGLDKVWGWIATMPEDRIGRWPWYQREFRSVLEQRGTILSEQGMKMTPAAWQAVRQEAHRITLNRLEKTFYNIRRYNNPIYMSRFLFGFPGATFNAFYRYGRMAIREPERSMVGVLTFEKMLSNYGLDDEGNPVDDIRQAKTILIPGSRRDPLDSGLSVPIESFMTVAFDWPSASYVSAVTLAQVNRANPKTEELLQKTLGETGFDAMFPYGLPRNPVSGLFSSYQRDLQSAFRGESDGDFTRLAIEFHADDMARWEKEGMVGDSPSFSDSVSDTRAFLFSRAGWRFAETFAVRRNPPGQMMRDAWFKTRDQYGDTREARTKYMEQYGDWARWYTYSTTDMRAFIPRSYDAYERVWQDDPELTREVVSLLGDNVSLVSLLTLGADDEFARSVSNFLQDTPLPGDNVPVVRRMTIEKFNNMVRVDDGWNEYTVGKSAYQAERLRLRTLRDEAESDVQTNKYRDQLKQLDDSWDEWVVSLEQGNPPWDADKSSGFEVKPKRATIVLNKILNSKNFMKKHGKETIWLKVRSFLEERDRALESLKDAENSPHRADIKNNFAKYVEENYIENDPAFLNLWDRHYAGEWVSE